MVNIPGIFGYSIPGAFSIVRSRQNAVTLPGGPTILTVMGQGQREEVLVERAEGSGKDGLPAQFDTRLQPDGRYYQVARAPVIAGSLALFLNPKGDGTDTALIEITTAADGAAWADEFGIRRITQIDQINGDTAGPPPTELDILKPMGDVVGHLSMVQGFRPDTSGRLAKIEIWVEKFGAPIDDIIVKVFGSNSAGNPTGVGTELATTTLLNADIPAASSATFVTVNFDLSGLVDIANLTEGQLYFLRFERSSGTANPAAYFNLGVNTSNSYGDVFEDRREGNTALWPTLTRFASEDMIFRSYLNKGAFGTSYDIYGPVGSAGTIDEDVFGVDAYSGKSDGSGFFDTPAGRRYRITPVVGEAERQHYYVDYATGQIILDHALNSGDRLVAVYVAEKDLNEYELFFDMEDVFRKHGFPSVDNTISQAAYMAFLNGAPIIAAIHAGTTKNPSNDRFETDIFWSDAFAALEKQDINFIVPIARRDIIGEVIMDRFDGTLHNALTGNGTFLQEVPGGGDEPGINIYPLAVNESGDPIRLEVYKNGILLTRNVDYVATFIGPGSAQPIKLTLTAALVDGDHVVANYRPDTDLVAAVQTVGQAHVEFMSSVRQRKERILFTGAYDGFGFDQVLDPQTGVANTFGRSFRVVYMFPERIRTVISGETAFLDGQYLGACAAGLLAGTPYIPTPLTRKDLVGFDIERDHKFSIDQLNLLGDDGITTVEPLSSGGRVIQGLTTVQSGNPVEEEISVVRIRDYVAQTARDVLENRFVGTVIDDRTIPGIKKATEAVLGSLLAQRIITQFANLEARVDPIEPRQVNVGFDVAPVFPLNWIKIEFSIGVL